MRYLTTVLFSAGLAVLGIALLIFLSVPSAEAAQSITYVGVEPTECVDYSGHEIAPLACMRYWLDVSGVPEAQWDEWIEQAFCESRFKHAVKGDNLKSWGLYQINIPTHQRRIESLGMTIDEMLTPLGNIAYAKILYADHGGWTEWSCRPTDSIAYTEPYHNARVADGTDVRLRYLPDYDTGIYQII